MIGVRHDGYHVAYKVLVRYVGAILGLHQFRLLSASFYIVTVIVIVTVLQQGNPFNPRGFVALHWFGG